MTIIGCGQRLHIAYCMIACWFRVAKISPGFQEDQNGTFGRKGLNKIRVKEQKSEMCCCSGAKRL